MKLKYIFLTVSLAAFAAGFNSGDSVYWGLGLPAGAVFFGLFMIFLVLEKETVLLEEQHRTGAAPQDSAGSKSFFSPQDKATKPGYSSGDMQQSGST